MTKDKAEEEESGFIIMGREIIKLNKQIKQLKDCIKKQDKWLSRFIFDINRLSLEELNNKWGKIGLDQTDLLLVRTGRWIKEIIIKLQKENEEGGFILNEEIIRIERLLNHISFDGHSYMIKHLKITLENLKTLKQKLKEVKE